MIKIVFLDLDDTILDFRKGERQAIHNTFSQFGIPTDPEIIDRYVEINFDCWRALERGEMTKDRVLVGRFEILFNELGINASALEVQELYEELLSREHDFLPGGKEMLENFKKIGKYRLFMATNGTPPVQWPRIKDSGIQEYFEGIFISQDMGFAKPDKRFFDACFEKIPGFRRDEAIIIGDSLSSDIRGGINAGILTCHFNPRNRGYDLITPHYKITELSQLIPLLNSIK